MKLCLQRLCRSIRSEQAVRSSLRTFHCRKRAASLPGKVAFSSSATRQTANRIFDSVRTPSAFHDVLRTIGGNNTLLVTYWTSSACGPCLTILPLLRSVIMERQQSPLDKFSSLGLAELDLSSTDTGGGGGFTTMASLGVGYGIANIPTMMTTEPRRGERRLGTRVTDVKALSNKQFLEDWINTEMSTEEPGNTGRGSLLNRLFGSGTA